MKRAKLPAKKGPGSRGPLSSYDPRRFPQIAKMLSSRGATQAEIAKCLDISVSQFKMWLTQYPELYEAVQAGNDTFTPRVERALAERAIGYEYTWEEEEINPVTGQKQLVRKHKYFPPEVSAIKYHLNNRAKDRWRNVQNVEVETKRRTSGEILASIYERLAKLKEQGYLTTSHCRRLSIFEWSCPVGSFVDVLSTPRHLRAG